MERTIDKCALPLVCLACLLAASAPAGGGDILSAASVVMLLLALTASALEQALPAGVRVLAPFAYCLAAPIAAPGIFFLPLALYDTMRSLYEPGPARFAPTAVCCSFVVGICAWHPGVPVFLLVVATGFLAALLALRTNRMLARLTTFNRLRDDLALRTRTLQDRNRQLEQELGRLQHAGAPRRTDASWPSGDSRTGTPFSEANPLDAPIERPAAFSCLTEREYEVARLVADGFDNREIAAAAFMGEGTVRNHVSSILSKLQLSNRTQLAVAFWRAHYGI